MLSGVIRCYQVLPVNYQVLSTVPLAVSLGILGQNNENSTLLGGVLYEMMNSVLEDRGYILICTIALICTSILSCTSILFCTS